MSEISFDTTPEESAMIRMIAERAHELSLMAGGRLDFLMDMAACHCNGTPLDLERLLNADDWTFAHDVRGIQQHISGETGKLMGLFVPKCAARQSD